jgi:transposase InsO family protein
MFIEIGSRRVHFAGCTAHPDNAWITQLARQVMWALDEREPAIRVLIRDNDQKFSHAFDTVFRSAGMHVIPIPHHAPNANAFAEWWIRSVREECLDKVLIINQAHLRRVMHEYVTFFNTARPHQGLDQRIPIPPASRATSGAVRCRNVLGGILHDYFRDAA